MQQFTAVLHEYRKWLQSLRWYPMLSAYELHLLLGGVGIIIFQEILFSILPFGAYNTLRFLFYTIPIAVIAYNAFFLGAWLTLASTNNLKYLAYGLWGFAFYELMPLSNFSISELVSAAIYAVLGYYVFKLSASITPTTTTTTTTTAL